MKNIILFTILFLSGYFLSAQTQLESFDFNDGSTKKLQLPQEVTSNQAIDAIYKMSTDTKAVSFIVAGFDKQGKVVQLNTSNLNTNTNVLMTESLVECLQNCFPNGSNSSNCAMKCFRDHIAHD